MPIVGGRASGCSVQILAARLCEGLGGRSAARDEVRTAIHEVGHAIVAHRLGVWVRWVAVGREALELELEPDAARGMLGCCSHGNHVERHEARDRQCTAHERATIGAGGLAAEALASGKHPRRSWAARNGHYYKAWRAWKERNDLSDAIHDLDPEGRAPWNAHLAYSRAAHIALEILADDHAQEGFERLVPLLLERRHLIGCDVQDALGPHWLGCEARYAPSPASL